MYLLIIFVMLSDVKSYNPMSSDRVGELRGRAYRQGSRTDRSEYLLRLPNISE